MMRWWLIGLGLALGLGCSDDKGKGGAGGIAGAAGAGTGGAGAGGGGTGAAGTGGAGAPVMCNPVRGTGIRLTEVATGFNQPVGFESPPGDARNFVFQKNGVIFFLRGGQKTMFMDISGRVTSSGGQSEQGLLGLAFHPQFASNGRFFVHYSDMPDGNTQVSEFRVMAGNPDRGDPSSEMKLLSQRQPFSNHNGGQIAFGPDGLFYLGLGDGGDADDPMGNGQKTTTLLGKMLRIDVDHPSGSLPYGIPAGNPDLGAGSRREILHVGLRNPWRFSFDRATGDLWIGDVGQGAIEEVDYLPAGSPGVNFGWDILEGEACHEPSSGCSRTGLTMPVATVNHDTGACSIDGGYVYRGCKMPDLVGRYFYSDLCSGFVRSIKLQNGAATDEKDAPGLMLGAPVAFGQDRDGELYVVELGGRIVRLDPR